MFLTIVLFLFPSLRPVSLGTLTFGLLADHDEFQIETLRYYDLTNTQGSGRGWERGERILLCAPLRDAEAHLPMFFSHLQNMTYPHNLIDLAFLVGDSKDNTLPLLSDLLAQLQANDDPKRHFGEISIIEKDFGQTVNQDVESRHGFAAQASRRKSMAQARNWLLSAALRPVHSWVYWRDVDVETAPVTILEDLMRHDKDVIVPNVWRPLPDWLGGEQPYDLNSWQESETALALADTLDEDAVIVEGYAEYATWRPHLAYLRDPFGDPDMEMEIDGVGGVSILAKAKVFRAGVHFPAFSFEKHAETEGFGKVGLGSVATSRTATDMQSRWHGAWITLWWDCRTTRSGTCTSRVWTTSATWKKWRRSAWPARSPKRKLASVRSASRTHSPTKASSGPPTRRTWKSTRKQPTRRSRRWTRWKDQDKRPSKSALVLRLVGKP